MLDDYARREGWRPEAHTLQEVMQFNEYIESIGEWQHSAAGKRSSFYWKNGKSPSKQRVNFIRRWIENEQFMCFASAEYFVTRYGRIRDAKERIIPVELRIAQRIFLNALAECDDIQKAIQLFVLKARQVGISTITALFFLQRILFRDNTYAVMASVQIQQSEKLGAMIETCYSKLPFWLPPQKTVIKVKEPKWSNGSKLSIQAGSQEVGISQGDSPSCVHISELGDYSNPKKTLEEGLLPACHQTSSLFLVFEGTGSMATTWQKEKWDYYTQNIGKGGRFTPFFIPPACAGDLYPHEDWIRVNPVPYDWEPMEATRRMRRRAELFVHSTDYLWKVLGRHWKMTNEFCWYWECLYREAVASHSEKEFLSQFAPTPDDAFQSPNDPVFGKETIEVITNTRNRNYKAYAITGKTIIVGNENVPYRVPPHLIDTEQWHVPLFWEANDGNTYDWDLTPLKDFDDSTDEACFDKLLIFQEPRPNVQYVISIDTAYGLNMPNEDRAHLTVHRYDGPDAPQEQVAAFTSLRVNSPQMARVAAAIAVLYGTDGRGRITSSDPMVAKFIIEQVRKPGDECQHQLKIMGFVHHHIMVYYDRKGHFDPNRGAHEGWRTSRVTRSILLERFVDAVNTNWLILHDPIAIRQLGTFVRKYQEKGLSEMIHATGAHDDNLFPNAMAWTTTHDAENTAQRLERKNRIPRKEDQGEDQWCSRAISV